MGDVAIKVEDLSKSYLLGQLRGYDTLRDTIAATVASLRHAGRDYRLTDIAGKVVRPILRSPPA